MDAIIGDEQAVSCPLCATSVTRRAVVVAYRREQHPYLGCATCGLVFEDPTTYAMSSFDHSKAVEALTDEDRRSFQATYGEGMTVVTATGELYALYEYHDSNEMAADLEDRVSHHLRQAFPDPTGLRILEIGCADGFLLRRLERTYQPVRALGIDPSPVACEQARHHGTTVLQGTLDGIDLGDEKFDVVVVFGNLMLHADPRATLRGIVDHLSPGGIIIFDVKNLRCATRRLALLVARFEHLMRWIPVRSFVTRNFTNARHFFGKRQLRMLCESVAINIDEMRSHPPRAINFRNRHRGSNGIAGVIWRLFDRFDVRTDDRAWLEVRCSQINSVRTRDRLGK